MTPRRASSHSWVSCPSGSDCRSTFGFVAIFLSPRVVAGLPRTLTGARRGFLGSAGWILNRLYWFYNTKRCFMMRHVENHNAGRNSPPGAAERGRVTIEEEKGIKKRRPGRAEASLCHLSGMGQSAAEDERRPG